jgi:hypothetical protein
MIWMMNWRPWVPKRSRSFQNMLVNTEVLSCLEEIVFSSSLNIFKKIFRFY